MTSPLTQAHPRRVVVAGDWHGNASWAFSVIRRLPQFLEGEERRLILHCGDFGIWPGRKGAAFLKAVTRALADVDAELMFVDGNHDNHTALADLPAADGVAAVAPRIWHAQRGHRWKWHGRTWLALGGGVSIDRSERTRASWWPEEEITPEQARRICDDGPVDVMLTHDCPSGVAHDFPPAPTAWLPAIAATDAHRELLQGVVESVQPTHLIHGHLHRFYERTVPMRHGNVRVTGLDCDGADAGNWGVLDLDTMKWDAFHGREKARVEGGQRS